MLGQPAVDCMIALMLQHQAVALAWATEFEGGSLHAAKVVVAAAAHSNTVRYPPCHVHQQHSQV